MIKLLYGLIGVALAWSGVNALTAEQVDPLTPASLLGCLLGSAAYLGVAVNQDWQIKWWVSYLWAIAAGTLIPVTVGAVSGDNVVNVAAFGMGHSITAGFMYALPGPLLAKAYGYPRKQAEDSEPIADVARQHEGPG